MSAARFVNCCKTTLRTRAAGFSLRECGGFDVLTVWAGCLLVIKCVVSN